MTASFNALSELPVELPLRLPHLSSLDLSHNQLRSLPESFGLLFHLAEIHMQYNRLTALPESFLHLVKLEKVISKFSDCVWSRIDPLIYEELLEVLTSKKRSLYISLINIYVKQTLFQSFLFVCLLTRQHS